MRRGRDPGDGSTFEAGEGGTAPDLWAVFRRGFVTCLLNPKLILFLLAFLPQFVRPEAGSVAAQSLVLGLILVVPGLLINAAVGYGGGGLGRWMARHPGVGRLQNRLVGVLFLALAARLALGGRA